MIPYLCLVITLVTFSKGNNISIGFLYEDQKIINDAPTSMLPIILREIETNFNDEIKLMYHIFHLNRDNISDTVNSVCEIQSTEGLHIMIDLTWLTIPREILTTLDHQIRIPYIRLEITIKPFIQAMFKHLKVIDSDDAIFIFNDETEYNLGIYEIIKYSGLRVIVFRNLTSLTAQQIKRIRPIPTNYAIVGNTQSMNNIMQQANQWNLISDPKRWNLLCLDFQYRFFDEFYKYSIMNQLVPNMMMCCKLLSLELDCICPDNFKLPDTILKTSLYKIIPILLKYVDEIVEKSSNCQVSESRPETVIVNFQNDIKNSIMLSNDTILKFHENELSLNINISIRTGFGSTQNFKSSIEIGYIHNDVVKIQKIKPTKRFYRIGVTEAIPWSYIKRDPITNEHILDDKGNPMWEGYCIDLTQKISDFLNFDYELVAPINGTFGKRLPNNKWNGLIGDLMTGETDIVIAPLKITAQREEVIDFISPYFETTGISIVIRKPVRQISLFKFMTVLRLEVWLSILAAIICTAILIWFLDTYSPYSAKNNKIQYSYPCREFTLKESLWFTLTSFTPQGGGETPKSISNRILVASYWLFVLLMLATFTANLAAFLTVERMQTPVQSLEQLAKQNRINYTVVQSSDIHKYFINMKFAEDTLYRLWKELTLNSSSDRSEFRVWEYPVREQYGHILMAINDSMPVKMAAEGFRNVIEHENADYAFIHDSAEIKYEISKNCDLTEIGEPFAEQQYAIAIQQGSQLQDKITLAILHLQKDRVFEDLKEKYWNNSRKGNCGRNDDNEGISLQSLGGIFIATIFGLVIAIVTLIGEIIYYRRKQNNKLLKVKPFLQNSKITTVKQLNPNENNTFQKNQLTFGKEYISAIHASKLLKKRVTSQHQRQQLKIDSSNKFYKHEYIE